MVNRSTGSGLSQTWADSHPALHSPCVGHGTSVSWFFPLQSQGDKVNIELGKHEQSILLPNI